MQTQNRGIRALAIVAICLSIAGLAIGYSALSQTLTISSKTTVKGSTWDVHFANLGTPTLVGKAAVTTAATLTTTNITTDVSLTLPGDSVTYTFDVVNGGTIDAKLSAAPTLTGVDEATAKNVTYTLTYADGTAVAANDTLTAGQTRSLKLVATFNSTATTTVATDTVLNLTATMLYVQQ